MREKKRKEERGEEGGGEIPQVFRLVTFFSPPFFLLWLVVLTFEKKETNDLPPFVLPSLCVCVCVFE